jgi:hypothetical protein
MDVVLDRDDLIKNNVNTVRLQMGRGIDIYDLSVNEERAIMTPSASTSGITSSSAAQNIPDVINAMTHWFYPENTLILWVPNADPKENLQPKLDEMADKMGLVPLDSIYPDFQSPLLSKNFYYYVDKKGGTAAKIAAGKPESIGTVTLLKSRYGLVADETVEDEAIVFARRPDIYE